MISPSVASISAGQYPLKSPFAIEMYGLLVRSFARRASRQVSQNVKPPGSSPMKNTPRVDSRRGLVTNRSSSGKNDATSYCSSSGPFKCRPVDCSCSNICLGKFPLFTFFVVKLGFRSSQQAHMTYWSWSWTRARFMMCCLISFDGAKKGLRCSNCAHWFRYSCWTFSSMSCGCWKSSHDFSVVSSVSVQDMLSR